MQADRQLGEERFVQFLYQLRIEAFPQLGSVITKPKPSLALVQDLLANAYRRIGIKPYDDAINCRNYCSERVFSQGMTLGGSSFQDSNLVSMFYQDFESEPLSILIKKSKRE